VAGKISGAYETVSGDSVGWDCFCTASQPSENLTDQERRQILARTPALEWSAKLPSTTDFKEKTLDVTAPDHVETRLLFIAASHDEVLGKGNIVSMTDIW